MTKKKSPKEGKHYVSNKEFYAEMIEFKEACNKAKELNPDSPNWPQAGEGIAKKILLITERLSYKPNFVNYTFRDEMISDALENCFMYIRNFNPEKSNNPFSYFTQISYYAFLRRIQKEKKQFHIKVKYVQQSGVIAMGAESTSQDHDSGFANSYRDFLRDFYDVELAADPEPVKRTRKNCANTIDVTQTTE